MTNEKIVREENENRLHWLSEEERLQSVWDAAVNPGGAGQLERLARQGKKPVRDLIRRLVDPGSFFLELSRAAGFGLDYEGARDVPGAGIVTGIGKVHGNWVMIIANDSRVKAGAYYPITCKKHLRAQDIADQCGLACVYIGDSAGGFLPMQDRVFPGRGQFGRFFYNMCRMSAKGLKQLTLSTGGNTAGGAYTVFLACESIMIDRMSYSFLGGPPMVKSAIGEEVTMEQLGGARVHTGISGGADHLVGSQEEGIAKLRDLLALEPRQRLHIDPLPAEDPRRPAMRLYDVLPRDPYRGIDVREIIACVADGSRFSEYKRQYSPGRGDTIVCGTMHLNGIPIGVVAGNGIGVIFTEAARKATEWVIRCATRKIPILYIQNSPGYMVGTDEEYAGIGKYGADMVRAAACSRVPKIQWVIGPDHGAANYGMCGRAYDPHFIFNTMRGRTSVMSGRTAGHILTTLERSNAKKRGDSRSEEEFAAFEREMIAKYAHEAHPLYTEARLYHDGTLALKDCRRFLCAAFEIALLKPVEASVFGNFKF